MTLHAEPGPGAHSPRSAFCGRRVRAVMAVTVAMLALLTEPTSASEGIARRGHINRFPGGSGMGASGNILVDGPARRGYQISREPDQSALNVYDLDTLHVIRHGTFPVIEAAETIAGPTQWMMGFDSGKKRIFAFEKVPGAPFRDDFLLLNLDLKSITASRSAPLWTASSRVPIALSYHQPSGHVYIMSRLLTGGPAGRGVYFAEERRTDGSLVWEKMLPACFAATDNQYAPTIVRSILEPSKIYLNCYNSGAVQGLIIRITLGGDGNPSSDEVFPGVPGALSTMFDTGSDRMIFLTTISGAGRGAWVFDGKRSSFLGVIATGDERPGAIAYSMGLDQDRGRLYMQTAAGILVADVRRTPLASGLLFRKFAAEGVGAIEVDPVNHQFFVPEFRIEGQPERYTVYSDEIPSFRSANHESPDDLTTDVEERNGVTGVNYSAGGRAFGGRILVTGGLQKGTWNAALGPFSTEDTGINQLWRAIQSAPVSQSNRELFTARVEGVSLTNDSADASAIAADADRGSRQDVATALDAAKQPMAWPVISADCDDTSSNPGATHGAQTGSGATCDVESAAASATAGAVIASPGAEVSARTFSAMSSIQREAARGIVSRSIATVSHISIMETVWIGSLTTSAEAWARGRRGKAGAILDRVLADVRIDANHDGTPEYSCTVCSIESVQDRMNAALGGQAAVEFPRPDPAYFPNGSPGGYQAIIQKEHFREFAERALNDDDTLEVPGMQLIVYSDGRAGRSRYVVQFAGVQAEAHYGIYLLPNEATPPPPPTVGPVAPPPAPAPQATIAPPPPPPAPTKRSIVDHLARRIADGIGVAVARPADAALTASLLGFFALPGYLLWRRRLRRRTA
jgi:hypothetical protein